jgi:hypothetical protein
VPPWRPVWCGKAQLPCDLHAEAEAELAPALIGGQHRQPGVEAERQSGAVTERQTMTARRGPKQTRTKRQLSAKWDDGNPEGLQHCEDGPLQIVPQVVPGTPFRLCCRFDGVGGKGGPNGLRSSRELSEFAGRHGPRRCSWTACALRSNLTR